MSKSKIIFFGTEYFSTVILEALLQTGYPIAAVVTRPAAPSGRGRVLKQPAIRAVADKAKLRVFQPAKVTDIAGELKSLNPTHGILAAYGQILPKAVIDLFPNGIINVHPSLLPRYRGPSPIEAAILNGDSETGISLIKLTDGMDEGPIYAQEKVKITPETDRISLTRQLAEKCANLLLKKLPQILGGELPPKPQDHANATYTKLLKKIDGYVDWNKSSADIEREIRAYAGWPKSRAKIANHEVIITKAQLAKGENNGSLVIKCNPGWLEVQELVAPSGRTMSGADFLRGYRT